MKNIVSIFRGTICVPILLYQNLIRPIIRPCCRFYPSCSDYALTAFAEHGLVYGFKLVIYRLLRCNPWSRGGYDPVPNKENA